LVVVDEESECGKRECSSRTNLVEDDEEGRRRKVEESKLFVAGRGREATVMLVIEEGLGSEGDGEDDHVAASIGRNSSQRVVPACRCEVLVWTFRCAPSKN
jgi:hypothetical protein